ncbi:transposase, partial [bacterium]|nr:transposase [bacterium]
MAKRLHTPEEKAHLVLECLRGERTINEIASENNVHPNMLSRWKVEAEKNLFTIFQDNAA